jgi:hypothetical protein
MFPDAARGSGVSALPLARRFYDAPLFSQDISGVCHGLRIAGRGSKSHKLNE